MKEYDKLVRDKIPQIIIANGQKPITVELTDKALLDALIAKLYEEADEIRENPCAEELADLEEVILAIASQIGVSKEELNRARESKAAKRGGFTKGYFLKGVN